MAGELSAADSRLLKGADTVAATRHDLDGRIKSIEGLIQGIDADWAGPRAVAFHALVQRWHQDTTKLTDALADFEQNLRCCAGGPEREPGRSAEHVTSLVSRLGGC